MCGEAYFDSDVSGSIRSKGVLETSEKEGGESWKVMGEVDVTPVLFFLPTDV